MNPDDLPPQYQDSTRPQQPQQLFEELPVEEIPPAEQPPPEEPPRAPEPFMRRS